MRAIIDHLVTRVLQRGNNRIFQLNSAMIGAYGNSKRTSIHVGPSVTFSTEIGNPELSLSFPITPKLFPLRASRISKAPHFFLAAHSISSSRLLS